VVQGHPSLESAPGWFATPLRTRRPARTLCPPPAIPRPPALTERPKAGFAIPLGPWLRGPLRPWAEDLLAPSLLRRQGLLRPEPVQRLWSEHLSGQADHTPRLWTVLMWQAWLAEWSTGV